MEPKIFDNHKDVLKFCDENNIPSTDPRLIVIGEKTEKARKDFASFSIPGFSEVFTRSRINCIDNRLIFHRCMNCVRLLEGGEEFAITPALKSKNFELWALNKGTLEYKTNQWDVIIPKDQKLKRPDRIRVATKRKILEWKEYWERREVIFREFNEERLRKNKEFTERVLTIYPEARVISKENGWTERIQFSWKALEVTMEARTGGDFDYSVRMERYPSMEEILKGDTNYVKKKITDWLEKHRVTDYTINDDFTIDVVGDVNLNEKGLKKFPDYIQFGKVKGYFDCHNNRLTSLKGAPKKVGRSFWCNQNSLTSLKGAPQIVGGEFDCSNNLLTSLEGAPQEVSEWFYCSDNKLTSLKGAPKEVGGCFYCSNNHLTSLEGAPKKIGEYFDCRYNCLTSLEGAPEEVGGNFYCEGNPDCVLTNNIVFTGKGKLLHD